MVLKYLSRPLRTSAGDITFAGLHSLAQSCAMTLRRTVILTSWLRFICTRNRLVHGYDEIDFDVLWRIVTVELPPLVEQITAILADEFAGSL